MIKVLLVKTSSMGDIIHTLPALSDASTKLGDIQFDWVVEEAFAEIPAWHQAVGSVIPVAIRRWRKRPLTALKSAEWRRFRQHIKQQAYDVIVDPQGLYKSACLCLMAQGERHGYDRQSIKEPLASYFYQKRHRVNKSQHAVSRIRQLFAQIFHYSMPETDPAYAIDLVAEPARRKKKYIVLVHATSRAEKLWPEQSWVVLAQTFAESGYEVQLPWGNAEEKQQALRIGAACDAAVVLPRSNLSQLAQILAGAKAVVAVDTGLAHLAAALSLPTVTLYGPTDPQLIGTYGQDQIHLTRQRIELITPEMVLQPLRDYL